MSDELAEAEAWLRKPYLKLTGPTTADAVAIVMAEYDRLKTEEIILSTKLAVRYDLIRRLKAENAELRKALRDALSLFDRTSGAEEWEAAEYRVRAALAAVENGSPDA